MLYLKTLSELINPNSRPIDVTAVAGNARLLSIENVQLSICMNYIKMEYRYETMLNIHLIVLNN